MSQKKTKIIFVADSTDGDYKRDEWGYIDGYVQGGNNRPLAVVVKGNQKIVLADIHHLRSVEAEHKTWLETGPWD